MPPVLPHQIDLSKDRDSNPVLKGLKVLILVLPVFLILLLVNRVLVGDWIVVAILVLAISITLLSGRYLRKGKAGRVTLFLSVFFVVMITIVSTLGGGIHDIVIVAYPLVLGFSSILLKIREIIITSILSLLSIGWLVINEACGFYPSQSINSGLASDFVSSSTLILMGALLTFFITLNIKESLKQANSERDKKKLAAKMLNQELNEKNLLIAEVHRKVAKSLSYIGLLADLSHDGDGDEFKNLRRKIISIESAHNVLNESSALQQINLREYVPVLLSKYRALYSRKHDCLRASISDIFVSLDEAVSFGFCLLELIHKEESNIDSINVDLRSDSDKVVLSIQNLRLTQDQSEQSPDPGSILIDMMVRQLGGQLERVSEGDTSSIRFRFKPKERR